MFGANVATGASAWAPGVAAPATDLIDVGTDSFLARPSIGSRARSEIDSHEPRSPDGVRLSRRVPPPPSRGFQRPHLSTATAWIHSRR